MGKSLVSCFFMRHSVYMPCDDGSHEHVDDYEAAVGVLQCVLDRHLGSFFLFSVAILMPKKWYEHKQSTCA